MTHTTDENTHLKHRADSLLVASREGRSEDIQELLWSGTNVEARDADGLTPLMLAAKNQQYDAIWCLLRNGASVDPQDPSGRTALIWAITNSGGYDEVDTLDYDEMDTQGFGEVDTLLNWGADRNLASKDGTTPLMWARASGNIRVMKYLLLKSADPHAKDDDGMTVMDHAAHDIFACGISWIQ